MAFKFFKQAIGRMPGRVRKEKMEINGLPQGSMRQTSMVRRWIQGILCRFFHSGDTVFCWVLAWD